jgi:pimeloyl-ACP methyl ester carboxylesterase
MGNANSSRRIVCGGRLATITVLCLVASIRIPVQGLRSDPDITVALSIDPSTRDANVGWHDPSPHRVRLITVDSSVRLEVLDWGGSGRPAVLLGCYLTAHVYDDFAPKLADRFHVYGITRRGLGASDKPASGYTVQRSAEDVLDVVDALKLERPLLIGNSCAGQLLTVLGSQRSDRLGGLVYLDAADDPTLKLTDYGVPLIDAARLPASVKPAPSPDYSSFEAYRSAQRRDHGVAFPEAELRQLFAANPSGSMGQPLLSPAIRKAIVDDNSNVKPQYGGIRVPVLAIFRTALYEEVERDSPPRNEDERTALKAKYAFSRAMVSRWERDLLAGVPTARIVELPGANLYMFLSNEADVLREVRAFAGAVSRWNWRRM